MARERLTFRLTPWLHAALVGVAAAAAYIEELHMHVGGVWVGLAIVVFSRIVGAGIAHTTRLPRRRETQVQQLHELRRLTRELVTATHGLSNQAAVVVGQIDEVVERLERE